MPLFPKFMEFGFGGGGSGGGRSKRGMIDGKRGNKGGVSLVAMERRGKEGSSGRQRIPWLSFLIQYFYTQKYTQIS